MSTRDKRRNSRPESRPSSVNTIASHLGDEPKPTPDDERLAYSVDEVARLTGLSRDLLYDQMRCGNLDYIKVGRRRLITRQHLEQFLQITPEPQLPPASIRTTSSGAAGDTP
jgi:excisionase family DNA binding protein